MARRKKQRNKHKQTQLRRSMRSQGFTPREKMDIETLASLRALQQAYIDNAAELQPLIDALVTQIESEDQQYSDGVAIMPESVKRE